ncbi:MAG TPA: methyltransferase domain-containing protein, partial [Solirubrobacteraceae bacterium]|nr:methyltransferase domain-containing protein [Solirubrobacteraceae bacterium]
VARALGSGARVTGIDVAEPMLAAAARAHAETEPGGGGATVDFLLGDAQTHPFAPERFDLIVSRCGVMFFADPVAAFANLRAATTNGGGLRFVAWRSAEENPFMTTAERAARPLLGPDRLPLRDPDAPGQFAFANADILRGVLGDAGWADVELRALDTPCAFPEAQLLPYVTRVGPLANALRAVDDDATRARVLDAVREAFAPFVHDGEVRFTARMWDVGATNASQR